MITQGNIPSMRHTKKPASGSRSKKPANRVQATGVVRIISGQWRGRKLPVLAGDGLRPTTDRTKETVFNWLMNDINGMVCVDAFAGSGSLGFEALSRGAKQVTFFEKNKAAAAQLSKNLNLLNLASPQASVQNGDAIGLLSQLAHEKPNEKPNLIFLDPPFHQSFVKQALKVIEQQQVLAPGGLLYLEMEQPEPVVPDPAFWHTLKIKTTSQFSYRLLQRV